LGYAALNDVALMLLATRVRVAVTLPGGHQIMTVSESQWMRVPLQGSPPPPLFKHPKHIHTSFNPVFVTSSILLYIHLLIRHLTNSYALHPSLSLTIPFIHPCITNIHTYLDFHFLFRPFILSSISLST
jgi:hypothetical protein